MLQYKNGRFYETGISFAFPENFYLKTAAEVVYEAGVVAIPPDHSYLLMMDYGKYKYSREGLAEILTPSCGFQALEPIEVISLNGLTGHQCTYRNPVEQFYEVCFDLAPGWGFNFYLSCGPKQNILALKHSWEVQNILYSIRAETDR